MQRSKSAGRFTKHETSQGRHSSQKFTAIILFIAMSSWLASTAYILGQLEIKHSRLILTNEGCDHLKQCNIIPQAIPGSDRCVVELPFRPNQFNDGGRAITGQGTIRLPEHQLVSFKLLEEQHWWAERWPLLLWEAICSALLLYSIWLLGKAMNGGIV